MKLVSLHPPLSQKFGTCSLVGQETTSFYNWFPGTGGARDKFGGCWCRLASFATCLWQGALKNGGDTHARKSTEVHGHPALTSLRKGGDKLKIFALEQRSLLEPVDGKMRGHANQVDVWSRFYGTFGAAFTARLEPLLRHI